MSYISGSVPIYFHRVDHEDTPQKIADKYGVKPEAVEGYGDTTRPGDVVVINFKR